MVVLTIFDDANISVSNHTRKMYKNYLCLRCLNIGKIYFKRPRLFLDILLS
nr:MAG TPA: RING finger protein Z FEVER VIRUS-Z, RING, NEGATIVE [Caudoviricetes sp.]